MNEDATKNKLKVVSLKFSSISRISLTQTFSFILFLASKRVRVNISAVSCSYNEWFRRRAEDLLFLATFESVMKKSDVGTVFLHNALRTGSKWHRQVVTGCRTLHESSCHLTSPSTTLWW